jgi:hypothetical protein
VTFHSVVAGRSLAFAHLPHQIALENLRLGTAWITASAYPVTLISSPIAKGRGPLQALVPHVNAQLLAD